MGCGGSKDAKGPRMSHKANVRSGSRLSLSGAVVPNAVAVQIDHRSSVAYHDTSNLRPISKQNALVLNARVANSSNLTATNPDEARTVRRTVLMVPENVGAGGFFKVELYGALCKIVLPPDYTANARVVVLVPVSHIQNQTRDTASPSTNSYVENERADTFYS